MNPYLGSLSKKWSKNKKVTFSKNVTLSFINDLAEKAQPLGFRVHVTSAYRSPATQARVVCNNVVNTNGKNLSVYGKTTRGVYKKHCPNNMDAIVKYETEKLEKAIKRDPNYQGHGTGFAIDLSVYKMSTAKKKEYKKLIESMGAEVLWEKSPEHFHVWLKDYKPVNFGWTKVLAYGGLAVAILLSGILTFIVAKRKGLIALGSRASSIIFYHLPTCPYCAKVRDYLDSQDIGYTLKDVSNPKIKRQMMKIRKDGKTTVPFLIVDGMQISDSERIIRYFKELV